jgi:SAM-dependent methyltransferase
MLQRVVRDRFEIIQPYIGRGEVLDLGCVDARPARQDSRDRIEHKPNMLFKRIVETNPLTLGVDIDAAGVEALRKLGFAVACADVETMDLGREFDAIVAGELIEHLENPGLFLGNMKRHLKKGGVLILSTPNPFYMGQSWKIWRDGHPRVHEDHTHWHDPITLGHLLARRGFSMVEGAWIQPRHSLFKAVTRLLPPYFSHSFILVTRSSSG